MLIITFRGRIAQKRHSTAVPRERAAPDVTTACSRLRDSAAPYTGRQVWNEQPKSETLIDVEDVALGYTTRHTRSDQAKWVWSEQAAQEPLILATANAAIRAISTQAADREARTREIQQSLRRPCTPLVLRPAYWSLIRPSALRQWYAVTTRARNSALW